MILGFKNLIDVRRSSELRFNRRFDENLIKLVKGLKNLS